MTEKNGVWLHSFKPNKFRIELFPNWNEEPESGSGAQLITCSVNARTRIGVSDTLVASQEW